MPGISLTRFFKENNVPKTIPSTKKVCKSVLVKGSGPIRNSVSAASSAAIKVLYQEHKSGSRRSYILVLILLLCYIIFMKIFIDKLAYLQINNKKLLVSLSKGKDTWYIPGGKREQGETDAQALIREVKEELSVDIKKDILQKYGIFQAPAHGKPEGTSVQMTCYMADYQGEIQPSAEIEKLDYFTYSQKEKCSAVDNLIFEDLHKKGLIE